jgi:hypothetical protein
MEQAASLRSKAEEMQRQEAEHIDSVIQVSHPLHPPSLHAVLSPAHQLQKKIVEQNGIFLLSPEVNKYTLSFE